MVFHDEIVKLQERVAALEAVLEQKTDPEPEPAAEPELTIDYLSTLTADELGDLFKSGKIDAAEFGAALTRGEIRASLTERIGELEDEILDKGLEIPFEPAPAAAEENGAGTSKSSGDDQVAGDWTQAGDGTDYPSEKAGQ